MAEVAIRATAAEPAVALRLAHPDDRFEVKAQDPDVDITVRVDEVPGDVQGRTLFQAGATWRLLEDSGDLLLELFRPQFGGPGLRLLRLDVSSRRAQLTVAPTPHDGLVTRDGGYLVTPFTYPLLELLVYWRVAELGGAALHAAGMAFGDHGCVFVGESGAGKSTISRLCLEAGARWLSDDRVALSRRSGPFRVFGTPWHGTPELAQPASAQLAAVFMLEHAERTELISLSPREACSRLYARAFPPHFSHTLVHRVLATCAEVAETLPCYRLRFFPDATAPDAVLAALGLRG